MTLTDAQLRFLRLVAGGYADRYSFGAARGRTYVCGVDRPVAEKVVRAVLRAGFVELSDETRGLSWSSTRRLWLITNEGTEYLSAHTPK